MVTNVLAMQVLILDFWSQESTMKTKPQMDIKAIPAQKRQKQVYPWVSLIGQCLWIGELQAKERPCLQN